MCRTRNFYLWLLQVVIFSALLVILLWLSLRPKTPSYTIIDFSVPVFNSSSFSFSSSILNGTSNNQTTSTTISFSLEIKNPNKESNIYYRDINITVSYGRKVIGGIIIPSFYQEGSTTNQFDKNLNVDEHLLNKAAAAAAISNGKAEFEIGLVTKIKYKTGGVKSRHHRMELQGLVNVGSDGKIYGKKKKVKLHRKWKLGRFLKN